MLLLHCHWSCSPWFNFGRCTDLFNTLPRQVYYAPVVHLSLSLREDNTSSSFYFDEKAVLALVWFHFLCTWSFYRQKSWQSLYLKAITRNDRCFSVWLNTNKSDPLISPRTQNGGGMPACTDKRVDYLPWWTFSYMILHHKASVKYVVEEIDWSWYSNPYNTYNIYITIAIQYISVVLYDLVSPALFFDFSSPPEEVRAQRS